MTAEWGKGGKPFGLFGTHGSESGKGVEGWGPSRTNEVSGTVLSPFLDRWQSRWCLRKKISHRHLTPFTGNGEEGRLKVLGPSYAVECWLDSYCWPITAEEMALLHAGYIHLVCRKWEKWRLYPGLPDSRAFYYFALEGTGRSLVSAVRNAFFSASDCFAVHCCKCYRSPRSVGPEISPWTSPCPRDGSGLLNINFFIFSHLQTTDHRLLQFLYPWIGLRPVYIFNDAINWGMQRSYSETIYFLS